MSHDLKQIEKEALLEIEGASDLAALDLCRVHYLGKKGKLTDLLKSLSQLAVEDRPAVGQAVNLLKEKIIAVIEARRLALTHAELSLKLAREKIDITLLGRKQTLGSTHPITRIFHRIEELFIPMGFRVATGPEIENDYYNFEALNIPQNHPARAMHDTFYFGDGTLLRTHTSPVQIREMQTGEMPLQIIAPGRVYRHDFDMTHTPMFHQVEGLVLGETINFANLKGMLVSFLRAFFEREVVTRFRPSHFPFTEPSVEVDIQCVHCKGLGCRSCGQSGWLEVLGAGMVHPNVLHQANIDSERYTGYAFGLGVDRMAMLRYGVPDIRLFFENDMRFLEKF